MAKQTYLELTNRVLRRLNKADLTTISVATGLGLIVSNMINEVQNELYTQENWYTLYTTDTFTTVADTKEYAIPANLGKLVDLVDTTNENVLVETNLRQIDYDDPDASDTSNPLYFAIAGGNWRLHPTPAGAYTIRERYWAQPTALSADTDTSDLPLEVENCIILKTWIGMLVYLNSFEKADRIYQDYSRQLSDAIRANRKVIDRMKVFTGSGGGRFPIGPARFPSNYPRVW